jgi:hypothetical protein
VIQMVIHLTDSISLTNLLGTGDFSIHENSGSGLTLSPVGRSDDMIFHDFTL